VGGLGIQPPDRSGRWTGVEVRTLQTGQLNHRSAEWVVAGGALVDLSSSERRTLLSLVPVGGPTSDRPHRVVWLQKPENRAVK